MHRETLLALAPLGLFALLALGEAIRERRSRRHSVSTDSRLLTNFALSTMVLLAGELFPLARITSSVAGERFGLGLANVLAVPWIVILVATLLLQSFVTYWVHRAMHAIPIFWRLHRVHHSDCAVDVSTSLRNHPLELLVTVPAAALVVVVLGSPPSVIVAMQMILMSAIIWEHADLELPKPLNDALSLALITPNLHRVHHSIDRRQHDSNFGDFLTIWDRLFGTFTHARPIPQVGLERQRARTDRLLQQIVSPFYTV